MRSKFFVGIDLLDFNIIQIAEIIGVQKKQLEIRLCVNMMCVRMMKRRCISSLETWHA